MAARIACPKCAARLTLPDKLPDKIKILRCPSCKAAIPVDAIHKLLAATSKPVSAPAPAKKSKPDVLLPDFDDIKLQDDATPQVATSPDDTTSHTPKHETRVEAAKTGQAPEIAETVADDDIVVPQAVNPADMDLVIPEAVETAPVEDIVDDVEIVEEEEPLVAELVDEGPRKPRRPPPRRHPEPPRRRR